MKNYYKYLKIGFTILIVLLLARYIYNVRDQLSFFQDISWEYLLMIGTLMFALLIVNAMFLKSIVTVFNIQIPWFNTIEITTISSLVNTLTPFRGGAGVRAVYLKEKENLNYTDFATVLIGNYLIVFLVGSIIGFFTTLTFINNPEVPKYTLYTLLITFGGLILFIIIFIIFDFKNFLNAISKSQYKFVKWIGNLLSRIDEGWRRIVNNKNVFRSLLFLTLLNYIIRISIYYLELKSVGLSVDIRGLLTYTSLSAISLLLSITPGSLGIKEAALVFGKDMIGLTSAQLVSISLYDRTLMLIVIVLAFIGIHVVKWVRKK